MTHDNKDRMAFVIQTLDRDELVALIVDTSRVAAKHPEKVKDCLAILDMIHREMFLRDAKRTLH